MPIQTRDQIIQILENREAATARELSRLLKLTPSNIRHHLNILLRQGSVKIVDLAVLGRGRPSSVYSLINTSSAEIFYVLTHALLTKCITDTTAEERENTLRWLAQNMIPDYRPATSNPTRILYSSINTLNNLNYQARWEAHADAPRIIFSNCPYLSIIHQHPELCQLDVYFLESLTGNPVIQLAKRVQNADGRHLCTFRIYLK